MEWQEVTEMERTIREEEEGKAVWAQELSFRYEGRRQNALEQLSLSVQAGEFLVLLGRNGSGKSTLARHLNGLIPLEGGKLVVAGIDAACQARVWELRRKVGMVFQNPDNQFVSVNIFEDVAFGLENYEVDAGDIPKLVSDALKVVDMEGFEERSTDSLSGGQKQRIALAGVLALNPDILVFDEVTSMLDPQGRKEVLSIIHRLHQSLGKTVILITHFVEEAIEADRVCLMEKGRILAVGTPSKILAGQTLCDAGLLPPLTVRLWKKLLPALSESCEEEIPLTAEEFVEAVMRQRRRKVYGK